MMLYHNWQQHPTRPGPPFAAASPNLKTLLAYALANFGGSNLGIYVVRPVTGGTRWSTHAYGAANDWGYGKDYLLALRYIDFLIANHEALHVQMIVDEAHDRTWKCWRDELNGPGWKAGAVTGGGTWLHIETTPEGWADTTPIAARLTVSLPPIPPVPTPIPPAPPAVGKENDLMNQLLTIDLGGGATAAALFYGTADKLGNILQCEWTGDGNPVTRTGRKLAGHIAAGIEARTVGIGSLANMTLLGPLPVGDTAHTWLPGDFARVIGS